MKFTINFLIFGLLLANIANAETPYEQLQQMVEQLQKSPDDNALREKIIKLAPTLKPAPAMPEEAERHLAYGTAAFTGAKSLVDYAEAVKEFEQATLSAPWWGVAYFNLGVAQDKAENYEAALRSLNLARLALPDNKDIKDRLYQVEYRNKKWQATGKPGAVFRDCPDCPEMVVVPAGSFDMGEKGSSHRVTLAKPFAIGKTEVTQAQWKAVMGNNPSRFSSCGDTCPVEYVSWNDVQEFIGKLNSKTGKQYRLPSEAEWEYACRAGGKQEYCGGDNIDSVAWYGAYATPAGNSAKTTNPVATKQANAWGLYDMSGNVWEWVEDSYHDSYSGAPVDGTAWQGDGAKRVLRGGSWNNDPIIARSAYRVYITPANRNIYLGFRVARTLP